MATPRNLLKLIRQVHLYFGIFISPALLFFAFTGAMQTASLHETTRGSSYKPPAWAVALGQLHKKQTLTVPVRKAGPPPDATAKPDKPAARPDKPAEAPATAKAATPAAPPAPAPAQKSHTPMKAFFILVSLGLFTSTLTGIYMAYKFGRNKLVVTALLLAGVVIPLLLLPF